ncbi:hypothetical protein NVP1186O_23 [Vibrio phage 1.186.O._10N.286.49.E3]|nr:hypothetical protein NVP1186O_23 [Vibrio phage 1.186.O._10N.286.49.E3]
MKLFQEITYTNNQKSLKATDAFLLRVWEILCEKHVGSISSDAIRALLSIGENGSALKVSSIVANQLADPFIYSSDGAALFPDEFQPWESEDLSLCTRDGFDFNLTFEGEVMRLKMITEINKKYQDELIRIGSNEYLHRLEF